MSIDDHLALIVEEHRRSLAAPLSARKALLVAVLLDHFADRVLAQFQSGMPDFLPSADDLPAWRAKLGAQVPALAAVFALGSSRAQLRIDAVEVPIADYPALSVQDLMVSLYNGNTVQRVMLVGVGPEPLPAHDILAAALDFWREAAKNWTFSTTGP